MARFLNNAIRLNLTYGDELPVQHLNRFRHLYMTGKLHPHTKATFHLIASYQNLCEYSTALNIGDWAMRQGLEYFDIQTCGIVLRVLAMVDDNDQRCEEIYNNALEYLPHHFSTYDVSHNSIYLNYLERRDPSDARSLLTYKFYVKLMYGNWREVYLTLDTMLRLFRHTIDPWVLRLLIAGRPLHESYQVFMFLARRRCFIQPRTLMQLLSNFRESQRIGDDLGLNIAKAKAMLHLLEGYLVHARALDERHLSVLLNGMLSLLCRRLIAAIPKLKSSYELELQTILRLITRIVDFFARRHIAPTTSTFTTLIAMSGKLRSITLLNYATKGMKRAGLPTNTIYARSLLTAAGKLQIPALVPPAWKELVRNADKEGMAITADSWLPFAGSARHTGLESYVVDRVKHHGLTGSIVGEIKQILSSPVPWEHQMDSVSNLTWNAAHLQRRESIRAFCKYSEELLTRLDKGKYSPFTSPQESIWDWPNSPKEQWQRKLYGEVTLGAAASTASAEGASRAVESKMKLVRFRSLRNLEGAASREDRFRSWEFINNMFVQAYVWESKKTKSEDAALSRGSFIRPLMEQRTILRVNRPDHSMQIIEYLADVEEEASKSQTQEQWNAEIRYLRGLDD